MKKIARVRFLRVEFVFYLDSGGALRLLRDPLHELLECLVRHFARELASSENFSIIILVFSLLSSLSLSPNYSYYFSSIFKIIFYCCLAYFRRFYFCLLVIPLPGHIDERALNHLGLFRLRGR